MLRVEGVQLRRVATLPGLAIGVALVVDRGAVRLRVQVLVAAERGVRNAAVGGCDCWFRSFRRGTDFRSQSSFVPFVAFWSVRLSLVDLVS